MWNVAQLSVLTLGVVLLVALTLLESADLVSPSPAVVEAPPADPGARVTVAGESGDRVAFYLRPGDHEAGTEPSGWRAGGDELTVVGRDASGDWLMFVWGWIAAQDVALVEGAIEDVPVALSRGLWILSPDPLVTPINLAIRSLSDRWQWDSAGDAMWFGRIVENGWGPDDWKVSRYEIAGDRSRRIDYQVAGDIVASPVGGAALVREQSTRERGAGSVYIVEATGAIYNIGQPCSWTVTDSYFMINTHAAWSPDGQYVVLRGLHGVTCPGDGTFIYSREGKVSIDLTDPRSPYRTSWYRSPDFGDHLTYPTACTNVPFRVAADKERSTCLWSPNGQWLAVRSPEYENQSLSYLRIFSRTGELMREFLDGSWPCNTFQWSPDSKWLAYGGPSGCA